MSAMFRRGRYAFDSIAHKVSKAVYPSLNLLLR